MKPHKTTDFINKMLIDGYFGSTQESIIPHPSGKCTMYCAYTDSFQLLITSFNEKSNIESCLNIIGNNINRTTYKYDDKDRLINIHYNDKLTKRKVYKENLLYSEECYICEPNSNRMYKGTITRHQYDDNNRLVCTKLTALSQKQLPESIQTTTYRYHGDLLVRKHTEYGNNEFPARTVSYGYNDDGQLIYIDYNDDTGRMNIEYTDNGVRVIDNKNDVVAKYIFNDKGYLIIVDIDFTPKITYGYDDNGNMIYEETLSHRTEYSYNNNGKLIAKDIQRSKTNFIRNNHSVYIYD